MILEVAVTAIPTEALMAIRTDTPTAQAVATVVQLTDTAEVVATAAEALAAELAEIECPTWEPG